MQRWPAASQHSGQFVLQSSSGNGPPPGGESYSFHGGQGAIRPPHLPLPTMFSVSFYWLGHLDN
jgi:hypothetical protein